MPANNVIGQVQLILSAQSNLLSGEFNKAAKDLQKFTANVQKMAAAWLSVAAAQKLTGYIESTGAAILETQKLADQFGLTAESYRSMQLAAQLAGVGQDQFAASVSKLQQEIAGLSVEAPQAIEDFRAIGVTMADLQGKNFGQQFRVIADHISAMGDANARTAASMKLLGEQGRALLPILEQGSEGLQSQADAAKAFGLGVDAVDTENVRQAAVAFGVLSTVAQDFGQKAVAWLSPVGYYLAEGLTVGIGFAIDAVRALAASFQGLMSFGASMGKAVVDTMNLIVKSVDFLAHAVLNVGDVFKAMGGVIAAAFTSPIGVAKIAWNDLEQYALISMSRLLAAVARQADGISTTVHTAAANAAHSVYLSYMEAYNGGVALEKQYPAVAAAADKLGESVKGIFSYSPKGSEVLEGLSAAMGEQGGESAQAFFDGWTKSLTLQSTRSHFDFFQSMVASSADSAAKAAADAAKRIAGAAQLAADQAALKAKNRAALIDSASGDPRVRHEQEVAANMRDVWQNYDAADQEEEASNRAEQMAFYADPDSDPEKVYQERVAELVKRAQHQSDRDMQELRDERLAAEKQSVANSLGSVATLASAFGAQSKVLFEIGKAAAIAQAEVNAWITFSATLANAAKEGLPLPLAEVEAGLGFAAAQVAVAQIAAQNAPGRANGGPVSSGKTYLVGERGPELLTMGQNGSVTPNHAMGPGGVPKVTVNIQGAPSAPRVQQTTDSQGNQNINVIFDQIDTMIAGGFANGTSKSAKAAERRWGLNGSRGAH